MATRAMPSALSTVVAVVQLAGFPNGGSAFLITFGQAGRSSSTTPGWALCELLYYSTLAPNQESTVGGASLQLVGLGTLPCPCLSTSHLPISHARATWLLSCYATPQRCKEHLATTRTTTTVHFSVALSTAYAL